jgi:hypothetical protein
MNGTQLSASIRAFSGLSGNNSILTLADAVASGQADTVAKIVGKVVKFWKATGRTPVYPGAIKSELEVIRAALEASSAPTAAKDYASVLTLFQGVPTGDPNEFARAVATAITTPIPVRPARQARASAPPVDVRQFADRLTTLSTENSAFDQELAAIDANSKIKKADLQQVANHYLGYERTFKTRSEIIKAIRTRQMQDAIQGSRERRGEKIAV